MTLTSISYWPLNRYSLSLTVFAQHANVTDGRTELLLIAITSHQPNKNNSIENNQITCAFKSTCTDLEFSTHLLYNRLIIILFYSRIRYYTNTRSKSVDTIAHSVDCMAQCRLSRLSHNVVCLLLRGCCCCCCWMVRPADAHTTSSAAAFGVIEHRKLSISPHHSN